MNNTHVPRIIAMANMKGGVGKTTSTICTAIALTRLGMKVERSGTSTRRAAQRSGRQKPETPATRCRST